ncbi:hypothetical protein OSB04_027965 [Centaurea solstitialis]|uniref:Protein kinase domain-containing protein n=1 Tax=Centaurea solstitialis TaxID=347529 RepID=A0AA38W8S5_9ASTR|nr:hypothetical protein OSB04_027965 [Centaurea solstitialis]
MKLFWLPVILFSLTTISTADMRYAKPGCEDMCGKVRIPFPFGMGANCSINEWYVVDCKSSTPYLSALNNSLEVLGINLENQMVTVNVSMTSDCRNPVRNSSQMLNVDLDGSPFLFSRSHNRFVVEGCGNAVIMDHGSVLMGCSTTCDRNDSVNEIINNCVGINCCQATVPYNLKSYIMNLTGLERQPGGDAVCGSAFLMDENSHVRSVVAGNGSHVPISLLWILTESDAALIVCNGYSNKGRIVVKVDFGNGNSLISHYCITDPDFGELDGNPYIVGGSEGISISMGVLFLVAMSYVLYKVIKKIKVRRRRKRFFKRNGGLLLKQQEEADPSFFDKTILFTSRELEKATDYFNENRILGQGGQGTVYKGMLIDGRIVAVKKSKVVDESQLEQFINEVVILSQVNHQNVVKLLGCCLETEVPLLVSEFIPNGTLYDLIHTETGEFPISLNMRLQIATEVAGAVAYLHSATSIPIYHRDIKTTNILLDDKHRAKVSDFGTSRFVSLDQTHLTTLVKGTFGYLDLEYFQSSQFTEKSDVYSFGVVLVELLTSEMPISLTRFGENRSLATHFMLAMEEGRVMSIIDAMVIKEGTRDELLVVGNLAMRCLNLNGKNRPTMKEVAAELETIRVSHVPSMVQTNFQQVMYAEDLQIITYGKSTSMFMSVEDNFSQ